MTEGVQITEDALCPTLQTKLQQHGASKENDCLYHLWIEESIQFSQCSLSSFAVGICHDAC